MARWWTMSIFALILVGLLGCTNVGGSATNAPAASAQSCPTAMAGTKLLTNDKHGYCVLYPSSHSVEQPNDKATVFVVGSLLDVEHPRLNIEMEPAQGQTADQAADAFVKDLGGFQVQRSAATLGGEKAVVLDGVPGQDIQRIVLVRHGDRLYRLMFAPADAASGERYQQMEAFYTTVLNSLRFLPAR